MLLGELSFCVGVEVMEEVTGMVLALLAERAGHGAAEACLCIQRMVSRGMRASDPRVIIHTQGRCAQVRVRPSVRHHYQSPMFVVEQPTSVGKPPRACEEQPEGDTTHTFVTFPYKNPKSRI